MPRRVLAAALVEAADVGITEPALVTVPNVELLEVGQEWETSTGVFDFTPEDLASCIASQDDPSLRTPVVKLGHVDPRFDGQPSLGRIVNLRLTNNNQTLLSDLMGVPLWLAKVMFSAYPRRSIEGTFDYTSRTGNTWPMILTGVALLGDSYPAIDTLEDIQALWGSEAPPLYPVEDVEEIAASGKFFRARRVDDMPNWHRRKDAAASAPSVPVKASASLDNVRRAYYETLDAGQMWWWIREVRINPLTLIVDDDEGGLFEIPVNVSATDEITFGEAAPVKVEYVAASGAPVVPAHGGQITAALHDTPEETGRKARAAEGSGSTLPTIGTNTTTVPDPDKGETPLMEFTDEELAALGLQPGATREQVADAILGRAQQGGSGDGNPASQPETPPDNPVAQPATAQPTQGQGEGETETPATPARVQVPEGMVLVDAATLAEMQNGIAASTALVKRTEKADRDAVLDGAIRAGKFGLGRRAHYEQLLLSDPVGGKATIASLAEGLVPTGERGEQGSTDVNAGAAVETSYPAGWAKSVEAARSGSGARVKVVND